MMGNFLKNGSERACKYRLSPEKHSSESTLKQQLTKWMVGKPDGLRTNSAADAGGRLEANHG